MGFFDGGFGGLISGALGALGGAVGGHYDREHDRAMAAQNEAFQREVYQNQLQWKAADAKKAGLHPLAVVGTGSYSASNPYSGSGTNMAGSLSGSLGKLGEGIGDAFTAYMNKDEIKAQALKAQQQADAKADAEVRATNAQAAYYESMATEATRRSLSYTVPMASGREVIPGQTNAPKDLPLPVFRGLGDGEAYKVTPRDRGYDLSWNEDHIQRYGDELGQVLAVADSLMKQMDSLIFGTEYMGMRVSRNDWNWYPANRVTKRSGRGYAHEVSGKLYR